MKFKFIPLLFVLLFALMFTSVALAAPAVQAEAPPTVDVLVQAALVVFAGLTGFPTLLAGLITLLTYFGVLSPEGSEKFAAYAHYLVFGVVLVAVFLGRVPLVSSIDVYLNGFAQIIAAIITLIVSIKSFSATADTKNQLMSTTMFMTAKYRRDVR